MKLLYTIWDVLIYPHRVILSSPKNRIGPLPFALSVLGPITLLQFWIGQSAAGSLEAYPTVYEEYMSFVNDYTENFIALRELLTVSVPLFLLAILFFPQKTRNETFRINWRLTLYVTTIGVTFHYLLYNLLESILFPYYLIVIAFVPYVIYVLHRVYGLTFLNVLKTLLCIVLIHFTLRFISFPLFWRLHDQIFFSEHLQNREEPYLETANRWHVNKGPWIPDLLSTTSNRGALLGTNQEIRTNENTGLSHFFDGNEVVDAFDIPINGTTQWASNEDSLVIVNLNQSVLQLELFTDEGLVLQRKVETSIEEINQVGWSDQLIITGKTSGQTAFWLVDLFGEKEATEISHPILSKQLINYLIPVDSGYWICRGVSRDEYFLTHATSLYKIRISRDQINLVDSVEIFNDLGKKPLLSIPRVKYSSKDHAVYSAFMQAGQDNFELVVQGHNLESFEPIFDYRTQIKCDFHTYINDLIILDDKIILCGNRYMRMQKRLFPNYNADGLIIKIPKAYSDQTKIYRTKTGVFGESIHYELFELNNIPYLITQKRFKSSSYSGPILFPHKNFIYEIIP